MRSVERPARGDLIALADLIVDNEAQIWKQREVQTNRSSGSCVPPVLEPVDVVHEVGVVDAGNAVEASARTDLFERDAGGFALTGCGACCHPILLSG
jgi:hypothetical protein